MSQVFHVGEGPGSEWASDWGWSSGKVEEHRDSTAQHTAVNIPSQDACIFLSSQY